MYRMVCIACVEFWVRFKSQVVFLRRQVLGLEEQKESARGQLEAAAHSKDVELLEDALEEAGRSKWMPHGAPITLISTL